MAETIAIISTIVNVALALWFISTLNKMRFDLSETKVATEGLHRLVVTMSTLAGQQLEQQKLQLQQSIEAHEETVESLVSIYEKSEKA